MLQHNKNPMVFSLSLEVSSSDCGFANSSSQKATSLVGVGRTIVKGNKVMPSTSILSRMDLLVAPSQVVDVPVVVSSLVSGISRIGSGVVDLQWQKATSLVEDGWTIVKEKYIKPSPTSFDMALRSQKKGSKGKA